MAEAASEEVGRTEGVVETEPVADLVGTGATEVVVGRGTSGDGRVKDNDTVILGAARVGRGKGGVAEETLAGARLEAD